MPDELEQRLRTHVQMLAGEIGERNVWRNGSLAASAGYISKEWQTAGIDVQRQTYLAMDRECSNLEIELTGNSKPDEIILLGAHYDTVPGSPGADDNASGVAALIEIGRMLHGRKLHRTIRCVAFVNEESPFFSSELMGSVVYAREARRRGDDIRVMLSLEMLGYYVHERGSQRYPPPLGLFYPSAGNFIGFVSDLRSRRALRRVRRAFRKHSDFPSESLASPPWVPGVSLSDQLAFWREGYPGVMVTDTAFYRYPHYHMAEDTPDRICYPEMTRVVNGLAATAATLAGN